MCSRHTSFVRPIRMAFTAKMFAHTRVNNPLQNGLRWHRFEALAAVQLHAVCVCVCLHVTFSPLWAASDKLTVEIDYIRPRESEIRSACSLMSWSAISYVADVVYRIRLCHISRSDIADTRISNSIRFFLPQDTASVNLFGKKAHLKWISYWFHVTW